MPQLKAGDMLTPGVEVVEVAKADTQQLNEGARRLVSQSYIVTSFDSALILFAPLRGESRWKKYQSKSLALRVLSIPVDTVHVDRFYGPKEIMAVPFSWTDWSLIFALSVLLLVWVLGLAYFYIRYRDNKPIIKIIKLAPKVLPHTKAMEEIDQIKAEKVWAKEDSKEYYTRLTALYSQYRGIAVNYNQVVKALNANFSEKKALAFLYKLEKATIALANLNRQIIELTREFETRWLQR